MAEYNTGDGEYDDGAVGFLHRWSRRKRGELPEEPEGEPAADADAAASGAGTQESDDDGDSRIDPRTGKRFDELTDADMPPVEALDENADVSAFFARGVSQSLRLAALRTLWHSSKFNQVDLMAEYSGNFTGYQKLGNIVPHDMHRAVKREMDRARQRQEELQASAREDAEAREAGVERDGADRAAADDPGDTTQVVQNDSPAVQHSGSYGPGAAGERESAGVDSGEGGGDAASSDPGKGRPTRGA
ncbi:DUF3306 domain-containing protein [Aquisalimonas lutea]|uniref:DUF3306 domain-containing protein n=1 Tax=Aquisalimonas lutea TaxID=1327750 RepID=UPI0025B4A11C|nr:DUF3306 domain-containing protein [Aquisalimonas lutea]MDN3519245.1 DUF3306 domain-containing protein [Aquisalimonas lutea]